MTHLLDRLSPRLVLTGAGLALMLTGVAVLLALALGVAGGNETEADKALATAKSAPGPSSEATGGGSSVQPATSPSVATGALTLGEDGKPVPYWKAKQDAARRAQREAAAGEAASAQTESRPAAGSSEEKTAPPASVTTVPPRPTTRQVGVEGATSLQGVWAGSARDLANYLLAANPSPSFTVPTLKLAEYYVRYSAEVNLRADILWAQMIHETGYGKYGGSVTPEQNNYAGIGATGGGVPGYTFATAELGVQAHIAHMVAYVYPGDMASWTNASVDPRYDKVQPRGVARVLRDLDGRWAVPGVGYGARIENHVRALNP